MEQRIDELQRLAASRRRVISLAGGLPADELLPRAALSAAIDAVRGDADALQYGWPEGLVRLRAWIADRLAARGAAVTADDVIVTAGAQQALALIAAALPPGSRIAVGAETYPCAIDAFALAGHAVVADGPADVHYVIHGPGNPHGVDRVTARRGELVAAGGAVIADEAYAELRFDGRLPRPLVADAPERVWHVGTLSKTVCPGLRVGWLVAPRAARARLVAGKHAADLQTGSLAQAAAARLVAAPDEGARIAAARAAYRGRAERLTAALRRYAPSWRFAEPEGGFSVWVETDLAGDDVAVLAAAIDAGVAIDPGRLFRPGGAAAPLAFRLSFSSAPVDALAEGVRRLVGSVTTSTTSSGVSGD